VRDRLEALLGALRRLTYAGRRASASPAVASMRVHKAEEAALIGEAFAALD
jgi:2-oxoglutarate dehydrogenase complex dehydrogenase (E1) component-like enzyme